MPVIATLGRLRQEELKFEHRLGTLVGSVSKCKMQKGLRMKLSGKALGSVPQGCR